MEQKNMAKTFVLVKILQNIGSSWMFSTYVLFLTTSGLSLFQANILNLLYMSVSTVLDPFTGNLGDRIGQRKIYMTGLLFWAIGMTVYGLTNWFLIFAIAEITSAVGHAFMSEALESWLRNQTDEEITHKALTTSQTWGKLATIPAAILGGWIGAKYGFGIPWFLAGATSLVCLIISWQQLRKYPDKIEEEKAAPIEMSVWSIAKNAWKEPVLKRSFILAALITAAVQPFNMFWSVIFKEASGKADWLGLLWMGIALAAALGSYLAKKWPVNSKSLAMIIVTIGVPMCLTVIKGNWIVLMLIPFIIHEIGRSSWLPILFSYTNRKIDSRIRTSVNSLRSSACTLGAAGGLLVSGGLTNWISPVSVWGVSAVMLLLIAIWVWRWNHD
ncbi:MAG TPA: MFS transporter [Candidatus Woesebacteria bacterium]|nr:MFS transporter [Candidatus Woesebacteria bacterium]